MQLTGHDLGRSIRLLLSLGQPRLPQAFDDALDLLGEGRVVRHPRRYVRVALHGEAWIHLKEAGDGGLGLRVTAEPSVGGGDIDIGEPKSGVCRDGFLAPLEGLLPLR
jgi:hypothetical protein